LDKEETRNSGINPDVENEIEKAINEELPDIEAKEDEDVDMYESLQDFKGDIADFKDDIKDFAGDIADFADDIKDAIFDDDDDVVGQADNPYETRKYRVFEIIQIGQTRDLPSRAFDIFISLVIISNITVLFLETFDELAEYQGLFSVIETVTVLIFCVEYFLRIWTSNFLYPEVSKRKALIKFLKSYDGIVDLLTILPFFFLSGAVVFRMLRVARVFHMFRINTRYDSFNVIKEVLYQKRNQLASSMFIIFMLMLASSLCMYSVEHDAQPEAFKNAFSGIWWSMSTLLTVGYGDIYPVTFIGQAMAIGIAILGVAAVAIPTGILSAGFVEHYNRFQNEMARQNVIQPEDSE